MTKLFLPLVPLIVSLSVVFLRDSSVSLRHATGNSCPHVTVVSGSGCYPTSVYAQAAKSCDGGSEGEEGICIDYEGDQDNDEAKAEAEAKAKTEEDDDDDGYDYDYGEDEDEYKDEDETSGSTPMSVEFVNELTQPVSLVWDDGNYGKTVLNSIPPSGGRSRIDTFVDHEFEFTVEGTRERLGKGIKIQGDKIEYVLNDELVQAYAEPRGSEDGCFDRNTRACERDAGRGECEKNPGWMIVNCPKACKSCHLLSPSKRCERSFLNVTQDPWWKPGDLNNLFEGMVERTQQYSPSVLSQPPEGPWVIVFDNFISDEEAEEMINQGHKLGFKRSTDTGPANERGEARKIVSQSRTSANAWCTRTCATQPLIKSVTKRIEEVTQVPEENFEEFQLLQYEVGQYYRAHHDMNPRNVHLGGGPRILTFFLYLSDVEEGGETNFPELGIKVQPKKGRAVLWPSVKNEDSYAKDSRTIHEALPVKKGIKYAANHWIHSNNFKVANLWGCSGSFD